jgi:hypothetical protein
MRVSRPVIPNAADDPLLAGCELSCRAEFYPYGFPAAVASNSPAVLRAARMNWGGLSKVHDERPLEIRCVAGPSEGRGHPPVPTFRAQKNLLAAVADGGNFWCADLERGFASAWLSPSALRDPAYVRYHFLEGMACSLLDSLHVVMVHAACVAFRGRGVLLAGDSGAGKSSLSYACARRGWTYCSDDASVLVRRAADRIVMGHPRAFRFRSSAGALFPEFRGMKESRRAQGKPTIEVPLASLPAIRIADRVSVDYLVFLNRCEDEGAAARLLPVSSETALKRLLPTPWPRDLSTYGERAAALRRLCQAAVLELHYRDLDPAVTLLERLIGD